MEQQNLPVVAKRVWSMVRVMYYMLRKGITKGKLMADLNLMLKRSKLARKKAIHNMFHHSSSTTTTFIAPKEYEFSCSNSPDDDANYFYLKKHKNHHHHSSFFGCAHAPATVEDDNRMTVDAVQKVLDMLNNSSPNEMILEASPVVGLPGFGRGANVRQLRVTDSPFLHREENNQVDERAEKFIAKFYSELRKQTIMASPGPW